MLFVILTILIQYSTLDSCCLTSTKVFLSLTFHQLSKSGFYPFHCCTLPEQFLFCHIIFLLQYTASNLEKNTQYIGIVQHCSACLDPLHIELVWLKWNQQLDTFRRQNIHEHIETRFVRVGLIVHSIGLLSQKMYQCKYKSAIIDFNFEQPSCFILIIIR